MNGPTADLPDYDIAEGWDGEMGLCQCPECERKYSGNGLYIGPVYDLDHNRYESYLDPEWQDGPFLCEPCYKRLHTDIRRSNNRSLGEFA